MNKYNLQMIPGGVPLVIHISQFDTAREYTLTPFYGGELYPHQSGAVVVVEATKPDHTIVVQDATYSADGTITFKPVKALTQMEGDVRAKLRIVGADETTLASAEFVLAVDIAGIDTYARLSRSDLNALLSVEEKASKINGSVAKVEAAAAEAASAASNASSSASSAASSASGAAGSATAAKNSASAAKTSETNSKASETAAKNSASEAATSATNAAGSATAAGKSATAAKTSETAAKSAQTAAEAAATRAESVSAVSIATTEKAGIVKPDGTTISVASDGTIKGLSITFDATTGDLYAEL